MKTLTYEKGTTKGELIEELAGAFAKAAGYQLVEDNVNQWRLAIGLLIDGVIELLEEQEEKDDEAQAE